MSRWSPARPAQGDSALPAAGSQARLRPDGQPVVAGVMIPLVPAVRLARVKAKPRTTDRATPQATPRQWRPARRFHKDRRWAGPTSPRDPAERHQENRAWLPGDLALSWGHTKPPSNRSIVGNGAGKTSVPEAPQNLTHADRRADQQMQRFTVLLARVISTHWSVWAYCRRLVASGPL